MEKNKMIKGTGKNDNLQKKIDEWIESENPEIISTSIAMNYHYVPIISIVYKELIKSTKT